MKVQLKISGGKFGGMEKYTYLCSEMNEGTEKFPLLIAVKTYWLYYKHNWRMIDKNKVKDLALEWLEGKEYFLVDATVDEQNKITVEIDHKDGVWIEDCCELSRFIEEHFDRDVEDFELEVGSAGIGQPFKVLQQYINSIGYDVELLTAEGKKLEGSMKSADENGFVVTVIEKQKIEGKKRPQMVEVDKAFGYGDVKWVKNIIDFK